IDQASGNSSIKITATLTGLTPNSQHGFHIHSYGDISSPRGEFTYGHFNPFRKNHTCDSNTGHAGDFGNVATDASGSVTAEWITPALTFNRTLANS
ncbi:superoxide dismutase, partial [Chytridium lagenaria]